MTISDEVEHLRTRLDQLAAELAELATLPPQSPLGRAETLLAALRGSEGVPQRPVRVSAENFEALEQHIRSRISIQFGERTFVIQRDETAPPLTAAIAEALAETP